MGFRVANKTLLSIEIETDLPPERRNVHPSGALRVEPGSLFLWVENSLYVEAAIRELEKKHGTAYDWRNVVFIPFSDKENWQRLYPQAKFELEYMGDDRELKGKKKRGRPSKKGRNKNVLRDDGLLPNAERDELHLEIFNYLAWFHDRLAAVEEADAASNKSADGAHYSELGRFKRKKGSKYRYGADPSQLKVIVDKFEDAFVVVHNARLERADVEERRRIEQQEQQSHAEMEGNEADPKSDAAGVADLAQGALEAAEGGDEQSQSISQSKPMAEKAAERNKVPFLEEALKSALSQLASARELSGKSLRGRRRPNLKDKATPRKKARVVPKDFEEMFRRLREYRNEHGDCLVPKDYEADVELSIWVRGLRAKRALLRKKGVEVEDTPPGDELGPRTLNAARISRLDSVGFVWTIKTPYGEAAPWEDRFRELVEYYAENGKWPGHNAGKLGGWVAQQRGLYKKKDDEYMKVRAPKLDEVGFEWAPRGPKRQTLISAADPYGDSHINLPKPGNGHEYRKPEVVNILSMYDYGSSDRGWAIDKMIRLGYVSCTKRTIRRLLEKKRNGQPILDTDWSMGRPKAEKTEVT